MEIQIKKTIARKAGSTLKVDDVIDNSLVTSSTGKILSTNFIGSHF